MFLFFDVKKNMMCKRLSLGKKSKSKDEQAIVSIYRINNSSELANFFKGLFSNVSNCFFSFLFFGEDYLSLFLTCVIIEIFCSKWKFKYVVQEIIYRKKKVFLRRFLFVSLLFVTISNLPKCNNRNILFLIIFFSTNRTNMPCA